MADAYICDSVRTPIGRYGGALAMSAPTTWPRIRSRALMAAQRVGRLGAARRRDLRLRQPGRRGQPQRRAHGGAAGRPARSTCPGATINRLCGSGLDAVGTAARAIRAGDAELMIAGGVESMTRAPFVMGKATEAFSRSAEIYDTTIGWRFVNPLMKAQYGVDSMPETAENVAEDFQVTRADQDAFALSLADARQGGAGERLLRRARSRRWRSPAARATVTVDRDEHPRGDTTLEALAKLRAPFRKQGGTVTAGNASGVNDGAAALIIASEAAAKRHGLTPRARVVAMATAGVPPRIMGIGPAPATQKLLERLGMKIGDIDVIELNEAFAAQGLAVTAPARAAGRRRAREPERRRDRARPSAGHVGRAAGADRAERAGDARRQARDRHDVHRRRAGHRGADRARLGKIHGHAGPWAHGRALVDPWHGPRCRPHGPNHDGEPCHGRHRRYRRPRNPRQPRQSHGRGRRGAGQRRDGPRRGAVRRLDRRA